MPKRILTDGIHPRRIDDTPVAVIDFETTGLFPGFDRVVEVSVIRVDPGESPRIAFDTLVNPDRFMDATFIHGITSSAVAKAPKFRDIAGDILAATKGCVIAAFNAEFDMKFLDFEMNRAGVAHSPPYFCLMYLRQMLGIGKRCKLDEACRHHGIVLSGAHIAANDALASGHLLCAYLDEIRKREISTYGELAALKKYKFNASFSREPYSDPTAYGLSCYDRPVSRAAKKNVA